MRRDESNNYRCATQAYRCLFLIRSLVTALLHSSLLCSRLIKRRCGLPGDAVNNSDRSVTSEAFFLPSPILPHTRSTLATINQRYIFNSLSHTVPIHSSPLYRSMRTKRGGKTPRIQYMRSVTIGTLADIIGTTRRMLVRKG